VTVCKIGDEDKDRLESMPCSVKQVSVFLCALEPDYWEEKIAELEEDEPVG
jgi:hypothetical protein